MSDPMLELFNRSIGVQSPWYVASVEFSKENKRLDITVDYKKGTKFRCPKCDGENIDIYDRETRSWRHLNHFEHDTYIHARVPRVWCHDCSKKDGGGVHGIEIPWARKRGHFSYGFEAFVLQLVREMPVLAVARLVGEHDTRIWRIVHHYVKQARDSQDVSDVHHIAIDETSISRGHNYVTVVADTQQKRAIFVTPGKDASTIARFVEDFKEHAGNPSQIQTVCSDMSPAFISGIQKHFPQAALTFDKFHVTKVIGEAVDKVRREEQRTQPMLKHSRYIWLKNERNLTMKQKDRLQQLRYLNLKTAKAYQMMLTFKELWAQPKEAAKAFLDKWYFWATHSRLKPMIDAARTIRRHQDGILSWFESGVNNALIESMNSLIQAMKRRAKGYRNVENYISMIYLLLGKLSFDLPT